MKQSKQNNRGNDGWQQIDASRRELDDDISDQANVQVVVGTLRAEVEISLPIFAEVNACARLASIEAKVQMRSADTRHDQAGECQKK